MSVDSDCAESGLRVGGTAPGSPSTLVTSSVRSVERETSEGGVRSAAESIEECCCAMGPDMTERESESMLSRTEAAPTEGEPIVVVETSALREEVFDRLGDAANITGENDPELGPESEPGPELGPDFGLGPDPGPELEPWIEPEREAMGELGPGDLEAIPAAPARAVLDARGVEAFGDRLSGERLTGGERVGSATVNGGGFVGDKEYNCRPGSLPFPCGDWLSKGDTKLGSDSYPELMSPSSRR